MEKKTLSIKDIKNLTEEEKKNVLSFYGVTKDQQEAVLDSYQHDPERYFVTIRQMPIEEQEVSLLIAAACGVDINNF
jgi:hypothetical protein